MKKSFIFFKKTDLLFWLLTLIATIYGLVLIFSLSRASTGTGIGGYFGTQVIAVVIGYILAIIISKINYEFFCKYWYLFAIFAIVLLVYTFIFGWSPQNTGGNAWISFGPINFQPSEFIKIIFIITFAKHVSFLENQNKIKTFFGVLGLSIHALIPISLIHFQGDDGSALVFAFMFLFMALAAGVQARYFIILFVTLIISIPIIWNSFLSDYQRERFLTLFNLEGALQTYGWQQYQGKLSIASGELFGRGLLNGPRVESGIVSVQESDFIFSVAGEELGFIGCAIIILILLLLCFRALFIAKQSKDIMGKIICFGFFSMVSIQMILNIGMCLAILPVIGVTLPFFSSGGSSVLCLYICVGLVQSVYANRDNEDLTKININNYI